MPSNQTATVIGYDAETGKQLFLSPHWVTHDWAGENRLPEAGLTIEVNSKKYLIERVREVSTYERWEVNVREVSRCQKQKA